MKSGSLVVTFATTMPPSTGRYHPAYKVANAKAAIDATARQVAGADKVKCLDFDTRIVWLTVGGVRTPVAIGAHWERIGQDGWARVVTNGRGRPLKKAEKSLTYQQWCDRHGGTVRALHMLRRPSGEHPLTHYEACVYAKRRGVILTPELKSPTFATKAAAERLVRTCRNLDYPCWTMALFSMRDADRKCAAIITAGGHFAPIFGKWSAWARGASRIKGWPVRPTRIWGASWTTRYTRRWLSTWTAK